MKEKVSIIVPIYNVELYLEECLDSLVNQTYKNIEIILVNDGSIDRSSEITEFYASRDKRIIIVNHVHKGVSYARNEGLKKASGKYILFVDSDDTILLNSVEILCQRANGTGADIVIGNALRCYPDGRQVVYFAQNEMFDLGVLWSGESAFMKYVEYDILPLPVLFFIQRSIITDNQLFFHENIVHEDEIWCVKALLSVRKASFVDFNYYFYRQRQNSIMNSDNKAFRVKSLFEVAKVLYQYAEELQDKNISKEAIAGIYVRIFWIYHSISILIFQDKKITFSDSNYFSDLLLKIYSVLSYPQQRYCLNKLCVSQILSKLNHETHSNISIYN
ncbi:MAG: glycosyltransferase [Dysgonamonadaceae bacterium]|jgi:glycosyltransferase involved in cell wall biosynthesis|nr:glycosyltransferase [Dysgonamonadaceae bacterium]